MALNSGEPVEPHFTRDYPYITEIYNGEVDIADFVKDIYLAKMFPGDELYVSIVSPVPLNLYVTDYHGYSAYSYFTPRAGFHFDRNLSREQITSYNFTSTNTKLPYIIVDRIPEYMRDYDEHWQELPWLTIIRGSERTDPEHERIQEWKL
jgi:hypothetical protein